MPTQITLHALMEDVPETQIIEALLPQFEKDTGVKVEFQKLVYSEMHDKLVTRAHRPEQLLQCARGRFPLGWRVSRAGWLADLKPFVDKSGFDTQALLPLDAPTWSGITGHALYDPHDNYSMGAIYRTDLLADAKLMAAYKTATGKDHALPTSLADYVAISKFMRLAVALRCGDAGPAWRPQQHGVLELSLLGRRAYLDKDRKWC